MAATQEGSTARPRKRRGRFHALAAVFALGLLGVGVSMIVNAIRDQPETVQAHVRATRNTETDETRVEFHFADGSNDDVSADDSHGLFAAVAESGPGIARVTWNAHGHSIRSVEFHRKTYEINSPSDDLRAGIIGVALGLPILVFVLFSFFRRPAADADSAPKSGG